MSIMRFEGGGREMSHEKTLATVPLAPNKRLYAFERGERPRTRKPAPRPCQRCETVFTPKREDPLKPAKFCNSKCRSAQWRDDKNNARQIADILARLQVIESKLNIKI
jgi:hypothetical protein